MKRRLSRKMMFFVLVAAYLALLAHAFVPHHHHGEHTAFLNHKACPHEHHEHPPASTTPDTEHGGECETLKNVYLPDNQQKGSFQVDPGGLDIHPFIGSDAPFSLEQWTDQESLVFKDIPINYYNLYVEPDRMRGPPAKA